ncbi:hypothetical protein A6V36_20740 [Paraburkholderia ginsengiterrae]|uniref:Uncharacterized protein n=1 Tax=Paraburkholderia ginsengiterrae TaxID=1462993 RepID=A0A1A9ND59_9BURK|nr:hypothetical protein [Paraburkholderia ginsengiterrae]OAJ62796.1 hypothetical protein A6V36_20740 [Paraburkholderia ginsengiterrae]OAJ64457.1 hypothetical protein A6V37_19765 [Paraburkholderia ginsengiterrae]
MAKSGWDIAMGRIDAEFDIAQFLASSLVRRIAANGFRLPAADRSKFQKLPDEVIARIEQIVREAYLDAGEDVGGEILREHYWQQALVARREMVANGELLTPTEFKKRIGLSEKRLARLVEDGSVFGVDVDETEYFPALLADPLLNRKRLQIICRTIVPAEPMGRLGFLSSPRGSLGGRRPVEMLDDDVDFKSVKRIAAAWAAEWSRTIVKMYKGEHQREPSDVEPLYTAMADIDPRRPLWERASEALHSHGYEWPLGPYPGARIFTLFVEQQAVGDSTPIPEACVQILVVGERIRIRIVAAAGTALSSQTIAAGKHKTFVDIAKQVVAYLLKH